MRTCSIKLRMSSTLLFEAASSSKMLKAKSSFSSESPSILLRFTAFARILAVVVFPTPRGPQNKKAWAIFLAVMARESVSVMLSWPTTSLNSFGLYFLAETINWPMP